MTKDSKCATYELQNMIKALEGLGGFFNTAEDNERLKQAKEELKRRSKNEE